MLQVIRDRAQGFVTWFIVGLVSLSFALWGVNSYFNDSDIGLQVATVNGNDITAYEYQVVYQNERLRMQQMLGNNFDPDMFDEQLKRTALARVIDSAVIRFAAQDVGLRISDQQLARQVQSIQSFQQEGKFSKEAYEQQLRASGESIGGFEFRVRNAMLSDQVIAGIARTGFATKLDIETAYRLNEQERELGYLLLEADKFKEGLAFDDEALQQYYEAHPDRYKTAEQVTVDYLELSVEALSSTVDVDDNELESYFEEQKERFVTGDKIKAKHILIEIDPNAEQIEISKALDTTQGLFDQLTKENAVFEDLAKTHSQDVGSAAEGGDLGLFGKGVMDEAFEEVAFALAVGEISPPVRSKFGYHIIKVDEIQKGGAQTLADVREQITGEAKKQKAERLYFDQVEILSNLAYESPDSLEPAAEELGIEIQSSDPFTRVGDSTGIFANRSVVEAAFSNDVLKEALNSALVEIGETKAIVLRLKIHELAKVKPFDDVKAQVTEHITISTANDKVKSQGELIYERLKAGEEIRAVTEEYDLQWNQRAWVKRNETKLNPALLKQVFKLSAQSGNPFYQGLPLSSGDYIVFAYYGLRDGDLAKLDDDTKKILRNQLSVSDGNDSYALLLNSMKKSAEIKQFPANL